jgi:hypothetical protein
VASTQNLNLALIIEASTEDEKSSWKISIEVAY